MFCKQCGKEIPDNTKFCSYCGSEQTNQPVSVEPIQYTAPLAPVVEKEKISKGKIIGIVLAVVAVIIIIAAVAGGSNDEKTGPISPINEQTSFDFGLDDVPEVGTVADDELNNASSKYDCLLEKYNYIDVENPFFMLDCNSYTKETSSQTLSIIKYGYEGDIVKEINHVVIADTSSLTDSERENLDDILRDQYSGYAVEGCCTIAFNEAGAYYSITLIIENLDDPENLRKMKDAGYFTFEVESDSYISMEMSEENFLNNGYVKR